MPQSTKPRSLTGAVIVVILALSALFAGGVWVTDQLGWTSYYAKDATAMCNDRLNQTLGSAASLAVIHPASVEHLGNGDTQVNGSWFNPYRDGDLTYLCTVRGGQIVTFEAG